MLRKNSKFSRSCIRIGGFNVVAVRLIFGSCCCGCRGNQRGVVHIYHGYYNALDVKQPFNILYTYVHAGGARFYMTAQKGGQWVKLSVVSDAYELTTVKEKQMEQVMTANADGWAQQINQSGRVSLYGINFDTGKSRFAPTRSRC